MRHAEAHRARLARARVLFAVGPTLATLALGAHEGPAWAPAASLAGAALMIVAGAALPRRLGVGRALVVLALCAFGVGLHETLRTSPSAVVVAALACALLFAFVWLRLGLEVRGVAAPFEASAAARHMLALAGLAWVDVLLREPTPVALGTAGLAAVAAAFGVWRWAVEQRPGRGALALVLAPLALGLASTALVTTAPATTASSAAAALFVAALLVPRPEGSGESIWSRLLDHPARLLVGTFAALSAGGTLGLMLPASATDGRSVGLLDAAFTSVSAVCVTGLVVLDTPNAFGPLGQALLVVLIQIGGLGIMTFYPLALSLLGGRLSLRHERALAGALNVDARQRLFGSVRQIVIVTAISEVVGAALLTGAFVRGGEAFGTALWRGIFTSISAFCNAGFALQTDSLVPYADDPLVLHTVASLIVLGGLSPVAIVAFPRWVRGRRVALQPTLVLVTSALLLALGAVLYALMEWDRSLAALGVADRLHNAWFQSVTLRTAGFNSVDLTTTSAATQTLMIVMMFIGGSPGGTAGGVKTTTAAVLFLTVMATLRGRTDADAAGRRLGRRTIYEAASVVTVGVLVVMVAVIALQLTQAIDPEVVVFEVVSALGTVGLSIGGTAALDEVGKVVIMVCMFGGRVGPLTLFVFLSQQHGRLEQVVVPEAEVDVG